MRPVLVPALALGALTLGLLGLLPGCEDSPSGPREICGGTLCPAGQVCCNEGCGICAPPDGACIMIACIPRECRSDADCRTSSRTCTGCGCVARHIDDPEPACPDTVGGCGGDPCAGLQAACDVVTHACVLR